MRALRFGPGLAAGVGLGAFVDGILFHQILQWHHFVSDDVTVSTVAGPGKHTLADGVCRRGARAGTPVAGPGKTPPPAGLFHAVAWAICAAGIWMLWQAGRRGEMPPRH